jgi:hypothetical protein
VSYSAKTLAASEAWEVREAGRFFRLLSSAGPVKLDFYRNGSFLSSIENVQGGIWRESQEVFDRVRITDQSGGSNAVEVLIDSEHVGYDRLSISGNVTSQPANGAPSQAAVTVTNVNASMLAANANRRWLLIQNKSASGAIYISFNGAATAANGIKLSPGQSWESGGWCPNTQVQAIGDIASNPDVFYAYGT